MKAWDIWRKGASHYDAEKKASAVDGFLLHPYWASTKKYIRRVDNHLVENEFEVMLQARAMGALELFNADPHEDGFKIEKDKCVMSEFLARNKVRQMPILGPWRGTVEKTLDQLKFLRDMAPGQSPDLTYPIFIKACHLTQGAQKGFHVIRSQKDLRERWAEVTDFVKFKWKVVAIDAGRSWAKAANPLLASLDPGFMLVQAHKDPRGIIEAKVET